MDFEPGSIVTLKSGGPPLTVLAVEGEQVRCLWFAHADDRLQEARIPAVCLESITGTDDDDEEDDEDEDEDEDKKSRGRKGR